MGQCLGKGQGSNQDYNGYISVGETGVAENYKTHEPYSNQPKPTSHQLPKKPSSRAPINPNKPGQNTIMGKQFEDVKQFYRIGKELGRGRRHSIRSHSSILPSPFL